jgi:CDP-2,3-bis-(O-geranylgeranyl)-sn-glycerol synthase
VGDILIALWFFVPVAFANMAPVVVSKMPWFARFTTPIDFGGTFRGRRILGANKTWRGLIAGIIAGTLAFWLLQLTAGQSSWLADFPGDTAYADLPTILFGVLFGIGTLGGDAVKSFIKRQMDTAPGKPWPFFDQIGEILGAILVTLPFVMFGFWVYVWVAVLWVVIDLGVSALAYLAGWKERPW